MLTRTNRFVNSDVAELQQANRTPLSGYKDASDMSLEQAVESIAEFYRGAVDDAKKAKELCRKNTPPLEINESAAIYLYTMNTHFNEVFNKVLRAENPQALVPWLPFLKLFITALEKLPSHSTTVWRGVKGNIGEDFAENSVHTWSSVNSCSSKLNVAGMFAGEKGTLFCIKTIHGKDITKYAVRPDEEEIILIPGTCLRVKSTEFDVFGFFVVHLDECTQIPFGQHVMLSYNSKSKDIVSQIHQILSKHNIPTWFDKQGDTSENIKDRLAIGVENAVAVCCFITPDYQKSEICQLELQYAHKRYRGIIPCMLVNTKVWKPSDWLEPITRGLECIEFQDDVSKSVIELTHQIRKRSSTSQRRSLQTDDVPAYLSELIKYRYKRNTVIERFMGLEKPLPIEGSYINLAIVENKGQLEKEEKLRNTQHSDEIMNTFEEIYGTKIAIDVKDLLQKCKNPTKKILVLGRAGIGKSTFCRYVAYRWAMGEIWSQYKLVLVIALRQLTEERYSSTSEFSLIDIVKKEYFSSDDLSDKEKDLLKAQISGSQVLWLLDGYDEIPKSQLTRLDDLIRYLYNDTHHILTSRPYTIPRSYDVKMEITGFTDDNISKYVEQFFDQIKEGPNNASYQGQNLLNYIKSNPRIWGIAHIPVNLDLICCLWNTIEWTNITTLTMTGLYNNIIESLCRQCLLKYKCVRPEDIGGMLRGVLYTHCEKELAFLEILAFNGMEENTIILRPELLEKAFKKANCSSEDKLHILSMGILKSFNDKPSQNRMEAKKDHYFVHLSFQEYFAARYLVKALKDDARPRAISFIEARKYNPRFQLVFTFASGLLDDGEEPQSLKTFWDSILGGLADLVGIRHIQLVILCIEETSGKSSIPSRKDIVQSIVKWINIVATTNHQTLIRPLCDSFRRTISLADESTIQNVLKQLLNHQNSEVKKTTLKLISSLLPSNSPPPLIQKVCEKLKDNDFSVKIRACQVLNNIHEKAITSHVLDDLITVLDGPHWNGQWSARDAIVTISKKAPSDEIISQLLRALLNKDDYVKECVCNALGEIGAKAARDDVIEGLLAIRWQNTPMSSHETRYKALMKIIIAAGTKFLINEDILARLNKHSVFWAIKICSGSYLYKTPDIDYLCKILVDALKSPSVAISENVCHALREFRTVQVDDTVIKRLMDLVEDTNNELKASACEALGALGEQAANDRVIILLVQAVNDDSDQVKASACKAFAAFGKKAARDVVISALVSALIGGSVTVKASACEALDTLGEKAFRTDVVNGIASVLRDAPNTVQIHACKILGKLGKNTGKYCMTTCTVGTQRKKRKIWKRCAYATRGNTEVRVVRNHILKILVEALKNECEYVSFAACTSLSEIFRTPARDDVIRELLDTLKDDRDHVKRNACSVLGALGEKAARDDVIKDLLDALDGGSDEVKAYACAALGVLGGIAARDDVIKGLLDVLNSKSAEVRVNACAALRRLGQVAPRDDVINALMCAFGDNEDEEVYEIVLKFFKNISGVVGEDGLISAVVKALKGSADDLKQIACKAIEVIGEEAARDDVITGLLDALNGGSDEVKAYACAALGALGEEAARGDVIRALLDALNGGSDEVIQKASWTLKIMGETVPEDVVIKNLSLSLKDADSFVREDAGRQLKVFGAKAAKDNVINQLLTELRDVQASRLPYTEARVRMDSIVSAVDQLLAWINVENRLVSDTVSKLFDHGKRHPQFTFEWAQLDQFIRIFLTDNDCAWLPLIAIVAVRQGVAMTIGANSIIIYSGNDGMEIPVCSSKVASDFELAFIEMMQELTTGFEHLEESGAVGPVQT